MGDVTAGAYELTCVLPDCDEPLALRWELWAPLVREELDPDADPLVPGDAVVGGWRVECLDGHVILTPGPHTDTGPGCEPGACEYGACDHDHSDELRTWRRADVERLAALLDRMGGESSG